MTKKEELYILKSLLSSLYIATDITLDHEKVKHLLRLNANLQRSHTVGNGEYDNEKLYKLQLQHINKELGG